MAKVSVRLADSLAAIGFEDPGRRNPICTAMAGELVDALAGLRDRDEVRAVLLDGGAQFCAGGDLKELQEFRQRGVRAVSGMFDAINAAILAVYEFPKPVIAVVRGAAVGAGMSLALAADFVYAGSSARFGQAFINVGAVPDCGASWLLPRRIGAARTRQLAYTGRPVPAEEAFALGLADALHPDAEVGDRARDFALDLARKPHFALLMTKRLLARAEAGGLRQALIAEGELQNLMMHAEDFPEAMKAFIEKREPRFRDR